VIDSSTQHETVSELGAQSGDGSMSEAHTVEQHIFPSARSSSHRKGGGCLALLVSLVLREQGRAVAV
jgi:hypothetical protein